MVYGTTPKGGVFEKSGIYFVRSVDLKEEILDKDQLVFCSKDFHLRNKKSEIKSSDILFSAVGATIGEVSFVPENIEAANTNQNIARLRIENKEIIPEFAFIFFRSKNGLLQQERYKTGNAQPYLNSLQIKSFIIPIPSKEFQEEIAELVREAHMEREKSKELYKEAEDILLEELGLKNYNPESKNISITELSEIKKYDRMDTEFFQPKYEEILSKIKKIDNKKLGDIVDHKKGIEPGSEAYEESGVPFVRVSDVSVNGIEDAEKRISESLFKSFKGKYSPKKGDILFTKDGTIGISFVVNKDTDVVLSGAFLKFQKKVEIENEYLAIVLNSVICKSQIERFSGGAIIAHLKPSDAMNLRISILNKKIQEKISKKVEDSHKAREKSKRLLETAKKAVEIFIEKDEKEAESRRFSASAMGN